MRNEILKSYEPLQPFLMLELIRTLGCSHFLDIGANIGAYSLFASTIPGVTIHGFEANRETASEFARNVALNALGDRIAVHEFAVSDHDGVVSFGMFTPHSGANSVIETSIHAKSGFVRAVDVACRRLDSVLALSGERLAVKLDVEGHELAVLNGARGLIEANEIVIQVEVYSKDSMVPLFLESAGFTKLFAVGPDQFFLKSVSAPTPSFLVSLFESSSAMAIDENVRPSPPREGDAPIRRAVLPHVTVELSGPLARALRRLRSRAMKRTSANTATAHAPDGSDNS